LRIQSVANLREHWRTKAARVKQERELTYWALIHAGNPRRNLLFGWPLEIEMTRVYSSRLREFDGDNLQSGCKAVRDAIAHWIGRNDNDPTVRWYYFQRRGEVNLVDIVIRTVGP
jgi:hypothetical protein